MTARGFSSGSHRLCAANAHPASDSSQFLVEGFRTGDADALEFLWNQWGPLCARRLRRQFSPALSADRCEQITLDAFAHAWRRRGQFVPARGPLRAWLWRITYRQTLQWLRKPWFRQFKSEIRLAPETLVCKRRAAEFRPGPDGQLESDSDIPALIESAMAVLSKVERAIIAADMLAPDEIAPSSELSDQTGLAMSTVRCYRVRARAKLRIELLRLGYRPFSGKCGCDSCDT